MKVIIVGGVAGGASCAARLRRLDEKADILMVERGPYVSYANCGLPYHVGGVIEKESSLLVSTEQTFRDDVRDRLPDALGSDRHLAQGEDRGAQEPRDGPGHDGKVRQAGPFAGCGPDPSAPARDRPARGLFGPDRAGRAGDPGVDRPGRDRVRRGACGAGVRASGQVEARGRRRRRIHRPRDGREPRPSRPRSDAGRDARPGHGPARPGMRPRRRAPPGTARRPPRPQ